MSQPLLQEQDIILRAVEPADIDFIFLAENDSRSWKAASTIAPMSRFMIQQYIDSYQADLYQDRQVRLIVTHAHTGERLGIADLYEFDPRNSRAGVGIYIAGAHRSQGYGTSAVEALCRYAQEFIGIHTLYATIGEDNHASLHIFTHCGFTQSGILRDWIKSAQGFTSAILMQRIAK
ncbi:MAG: GNAT family N-acetyltransferase [Bacteroidales bacterium]|nr:GNAT family N-acetyltransferase [Bacteroidales bacterium]